MLAFIQRVTLSTTGPGMAILWGRTLIDTRPFKLHFKTLKIGLIRQLNIWVRPGRAPMSGTTFGVIRVPE